MNEPRAPHGDSSGWDVTRSIELIRRAQDGDSPALNRLLERYYDRVRLVVNMRMGPRLRGYTEVDDIIQETFVTAASKLDAFEVRDEWSFINWLSRIAEHKITDAVDHFHRQKRDRRREHGFSPRADSSATSTLGDFEPLANTTLPGEKAIHKEEMDFIADCLQELSEDHREVFIQRHFVNPDGSWDEIAVACQRKNANATRVLYGRAVAAMLKVVRSRRNASD
jgi:RNA polymerase sigma-70 factor (ECF subfamily)